MADVCEMLWDHMKAYFGLEFQTLQVFWNIGFSHAKSFYIVTNPD